MSDVRTVLTHVKENSGCNSSEIDCYVVNSLHDRGLISGDDITSSSSPTEFEYQNLRLSALGVDYLEQPSPSKQSSFFGLKKYGFQSLLLYLY
ncbi:MAG: hypothetical protein ACJAT7_001573 [Psychromonas sp.]|jgi:hypothetical protein|uniref:hypothetical protein n=1 Tax=Psychromonas sp. TaxID=1884585 RepID=UPI0039E44296